MIPRYSRPEMTSIWSDQNRFEIWLQIETLALEKMVELGVAPQQALIDVRERAKFNVDRVLEIEQEVKHDVIAFLTNVAESVGDSSRFLHRGMTSSDVLDTCLAVQLSQAGDLILKDLDQVLEVLKARALECKGVVCMGRSHGIHAEPTTFGIKLLGFYSEMKRQKVRFERALEGVRYGKIAGAVGTYPSVSPEVELHTLNALGLEPETVSTQVVARDRHADFFCSLAQIAGSIERAAVEVRHLQRTEVGEASEFFSAGQKGSSAMPHKRNPILSENLTGLARLLRSYAQAALENVALWHERDISHSSVERVIGPDACILIDFMLARFKGLIEKLLVFPEKMLANLESNRGLVFSGTVLIALADAGMLREDAYRLVQKHAMATWDQGGELLTRLLADSEVTKFLPEANLRELFDLKRHLKAEQVIFDRALSL
jgi:adenylosuccinate lyase